ncbi:MAG: hypothetical protein ACRCX2_07705 [Paraclostridium sp.]
MTKDINTEIKDYNIKVSAGEIILVVHSKSQDADNIIYNEAMNSLRTTCTKLGEAKRTLKHYASVDVLPKEAMPKLIEKIRDDKGLGAAVVVSSSKLLESLRRDDLFNRVYLPKKK